MVRRGTCGPYELLCLPLPAREWTKEYAARTEKLRDLRLSRELPRQIGVLTLKITRPTRRIELMYLAVDEVLEDVPPRLKFRNRALDRGEVIGCGHEALDEGTEEVGGHLRRRASTNLRGDKKEQVLRAG
jgi:hypothetical protein